MANESAINVELYNIDNGLSQSGVTSLMLDSYGFLWIGTQDGLNRYDGYTFKAYRNNPLDTTTLANNIILSLCEDNNGNLWIGTWSGLSVFNRETEAFSNYYHNANNPNTVSANRIFDVFLDSYGVLWIKTLEALDRFDPLTNQFVRYPHFSNPFSLNTDNNDFAIYEDSQKRFWVGTKDGLMLFDRNLGLYKRYSFDPTNQTSLSNNRVKDIIEDTAGDIWVATSNGLNKYLPKKDSFDRFQNKQSVFSIPNSNVNDLFVDHDGSLLVGTESGLCRYDYNSKEFIPYRKFVKGVEIYSTNVTAMVRDNFSNLWIGTQSGLIKWDRKPPKFNVYNMGVNGVNLFSNNTIAALSVDNDGTVWVGTWGTGLHLFNRKTNSVVKYSQQNAEPFRIINDFVHVIFTKRNGEILIGTRNGVQKFNPATKSFSDFFKPFGVDALPFFFENRIFSIVEDKNNNLWFATRLGLYRFNGKVIDGFYGDFTDPMQLTSSEIHCIEIDGESLWVGTSNGLNQLDINTLRIKRFYREKEYAAGGLISNDIICLRVDSKGVLWVGTPSGLHRYNSNSNSFTLFTERDGLPNNLIYAIEEDSNGNIWISSNWGLAVLKDNATTILSYGISDGLQSYEFNVGASFKAKNGELFFGGIAGFNTFFPDSIKVNTSIPPIVITNLELIGSKGQKFIPVFGKDGIVINQEFSLINIEFSALDFTHPQKNVYKYKMEGLENEWINLGRRHSATFSNLREGVYYFKVKGANSDNVWNEEGVTLRIEVKTIFWKSRTAFWIYGLFTLLSLVLFLRTRTRMLRKTSRLLKERENSMAEIEIQKEALLLQNKNITDSINYAKRIQEALIPSEHHFRSILPESFILYMPKDIVSGDFYWINETKNKVFVAAIDCTGHGVPGAFMSIIGVELLRNITNIMGINDAAEILNRLDKGVHDTFTKGQGDEIVNVKDGMDVSFCVIDKEQNVLEFAGAFSNLYIIRDSKIIEVKGNRYSVGTGGETEKPLFTSHLITIEPDDMVYMFTDGYVDQFGGPEGKKYKFRRFRHLLLNIHKYPLEIQRKYLIGSINEWKGAHEQVDDILIIGIKPDLSCFF